VIVLLVISVMPPTGIAQNALTQYKPRGEVTGTIRAWGSEQMADLMRLWESGFHHYEPDVKFEDHLRGTVSAMGGVYGGAADIALMGREVWPEERMAFEQVMGHAAPEIEVATGSYDVPTKADALVVFVHRTNPISQLTLQQLDAIFGAEHRRGPANIRTWGELGLLGAWALQTIHPYGYGLDNAAVIFFRNTVMKGSMKWNPAIREFANQRDTAGDRIDSGQQILDTLAEDPYGIAISNPHYAGQMVRALALVAQADGRAVSASRDSVQDRTYPLSRAVYISFNRAGGGSAVAEFLRYVLSGEGQSAVANEGAYLPLTEARAKRQLAHLETVLDKAVGNDLRPERLTADPNHSMGALK
jgi:phosphate transport system substrate-binding protein